MNPYLYQLSIPYHDYLEQFDWELDSVLTAPHKMTLASVERSMVKFNNNLRDTFPDYRLFWVTEQFKNEGYHIHFLFANGDKEKTNTQKILEISAAWSKAVSKGRRTNNSFKKHNKNTIWYILKDWHKQNISYGFEGNSWELTVTE